MDQISTLFMPPLTIPLCSELHGVNFETGRGAQRHFVVNLPGNISQYFQNIQKFWQIIESSKIDIDPCGEDLGYWVCTELSNYCEEPEK